LLFAMRVLPVTILPGIFGEAAKFTDEKISKANTTSTLESRFLSQRIFMV
jgi:hypothetical protein